MVDNLPAHTRVVVLADGDIPAFAGVLLDPPTTYGDMYQIKPDGDIFPELMLAPIELVHPEPPSQVSLDTPIPNMATRGAAVADAQDEFQVTIATLRRMGVAEPTIMRVFLGAMKKPDDPHAPCYKSALGPTIHGPRCTHD
jgi:hypothetical protein